MQGSTRSIFSSLKSFRTFSSSSSDNIIASVLFERLPVVIPKIDPVVYAFQEFSLRWRQQFRRKYPDEVLGKADGRGKGDYQIDYVPAPRITEADEQNDKKSLQRALDRRLYLLIYGTPYGASDKKPVWHFPEKVYENEESLRLCAESALKSLLGDLQNSYFIGNAPVAHMVVGPSDESPILPLFKGTFQIFSELTEDHNFSLKIKKRFFFKSQVIGTNKLNIRKCEDYAWLTKDEIKEHFPDQASFFDKMIMS